MTDTPENNDQSAEAVEIVAERPRKTLTLGGSKAPVESPAEPEVEAKPEPTLPMPEGRP